MEMIQQQPVRNSNNKRKEEGKKLKRQRIEQAGGKRPRTTTHNDNDTTSPTTTTKTTMKTNNDTNNVDVDATTGSDNTKVKTTSPGSAAKTTSIADNSKRMGFGIMSNSKMNNKKQNNTISSSSDSTILKQLRTITTLKDNKQKNASTNSSNNTNHRFGRVMDISPCINQSRYSTVSIAIPGSIVSYCQTRELKTILCGQIARAATIYHIDEIIIYNDNLSSNNNNTSTNTGMDLFRKNNNNNNNTRKFNNNNKDNKDNTTEETDPTTADDTNKDIKKTKLYEPLSDSITFMGRILQYCECPQYLRRNFFPMHTDLQFVGLLPPIDPPHHVRIDDYITKYREGIVLTEKYIKDKFSIGKLVHCGLRGRPILIDQKLPPGVRCTVQIDLNSIDTNNNNKQIKGTVVSPSTPREDNGTYWGYTVRIASSLQECFLNCPFSAEDSGYDLTIGTSERGTINLDDPTFITKLSSIIQSKNTNTTNNNTNSTTNKKKNNKTNTTTTTTTTTTSTSNNKNPYYKHALIVFGGVAGIEECVDADESMKLSGVDSYKLFDVWLNICQYQGSKTIRTEEAVLIALAKLHNPLLHYSCSTPPPPQEDDDDTDDTNDTDTDTDDHNVKDNNDVDDNDDNDNDTQTEDSNNSDIDDDDDNDDEDDIADSKNAVLDDDDDDVASNDNKGSDNDDKSEISDESSSDDDDDDDQDDNDSIVEMKE